MSQCPFKGIFLPHSNAVHWLLFCWREAVLIALGIHRHALFHHGSRQTLVACQGWPLTVHGFLDEQDLDYLSKENGASFVESCSKSRFF